MELTLPSNASLGLFDAIKNALKDKGVPESSVNITLKGVMRIPQEALVIYQKALLHGLK